MATDRVAIKTLYYIFPFLFKNPFMLVGIILGVREESWQKLFACLNMFRKLLRPLARSFPSFQTCTDWILRPIYLFCENYSLSCFYDKITVYKLIVFRKGVKFKANFTIEKVQRKSYSPHDIWSRASLLILSVNNVICLMVHQTCFLSLKA